MARYTNPRDIYFGENALEALKSLKGTKAFVIIGGGSIKRNGHLDKILSYLSDAGMETKIYEGVESDPSVDTVMAGAKEMTAFAPDWIIAVGGGSPIDAAKAMWIKYEYPETTFEDMCKVFGIPELRKKAHFCAITTTSGTGTEVTAFSIITDYKKGIKYPIADFEITPDVAIVDPSLVENMPKSLIAHTGMDALTHSFEAYVSTAHSPYSDAVALHSIKLIHENLKKSFDGCLKARAVMHDAQCMAGMSFSNAILGIVHSMAHKTGRAYEGRQIIHGAANAMYLPKVVKFNSKNYEASERYKDIAEAMGLERSVDALCAELREMNYQLEIPFAIKNYGDGGKISETGIVTEKEFLDSLETVAANAISDACTGTNPRQPSQEEMEKLLLACYYDTEVDF